MLLLILLIYSKNITGPKTVPCGTPDITLTYLDSYPSTTTLCDLLFTPAFTVPRRRALTNVYKGLWINHARNNFACACCSTS